MPGTPRWHLWRRITPGGAAAKAGCDTVTFRVERSGALELGLLQGEWSSPGGDYETPMDVWKAVEGEIEVALIDWGRADPVVGLARLETLSGGHPLVRAERARLQRPRVPPAGWSPHWLLGASDAFAAESCDGRACLAAHTRDDAAILRHEVDVPVGPETALCWSWRIDELPSATPEDQLLQHDYLSIAAEFACGRDLTWYWSAALPVDTWFPCPIPAWTPRETHFVVRSGEDGLGAWHDERRLLAPDYRTALGAEPPHLVAIWVIAVSLFQHGEGRAWFAELAIENEGRRVVVPVEPA